MRLHTDKAGAVGLAIYAAAERYGLGGGNTYTHHRSRIRESGLEVQLLGSGRAGGQWGTLDGNAATWDEWGAVLAAAYAVDDSMIVGSLKNGPYRNAAHFHWVTGDRYRDGMPADAHYQHAWEWQGERWGWAPGDGDGQPAGFTVQTCKGCSAVLRRQSMRIGGGR